MVAMVRSVSLQMNTNRPPGLSKSTHLTMKKAYVSFFYLLAIPKPKNRVQIILNRGVYASAKWRVPDD